MRRLLGIVITLLPFALAWAGPILATAGQSDIPRNAANIALLRWLAWAAFGHGAFFSLVNLYLSFGRPMILRLRGIPFEEQNNPSGYPLIATISLMLSTLPFYPSLWPCVAVTILLVLDTGGPLWFLIWTWKVDEIWRPRRQPSTAC